MNVGKLTIMTIPHIPLTGRCFKRKYVVFNQNDLDNYTSLYVKYIFSVLLPHSIKTLVDQQFHICLEHDLT